MISRMFSVPITWLPKPHNLVTLTNNGITIVVTLFETEDVLKSVNTYLVGGAVRDELLTLPVKEKDWLVTGATPELLLTKGFRPVGKDFPVFLHPETKEEYALARTEKKNGHGYGGFTFYTSPNITVEQDLYRRDLTINAIAKTHEGELIDPYNGINDLNNRVLRHVSPAFVEDPLRILRVARFAARFAKLGFKVAPETMTLMQTITESGELSHLAKERVWQETLSALTSLHPDTYFDVLHQCGALTVLFPELMCNYSSQEDNCLCPPRYAMNKAARQERDSRIRFACGFIPWNACLEDPGKTCQQLSQALHRLKIPTGYQDVLMLTAQYMPVLLELKEPTAETLLNLLERMDAFRRKDRFLISLAACDYLLNASKQQRGQRIRLKQAMITCQNIDVQALIHQGFKGKDLAVKIHKVRLKKISVLLSKH